MKLTIIALILAAFLFVGCSVSDNPEMNKEDYKIVQIEYHDYIVYGNEITHSERCHTCHAEFGTWLFLTIFAWAVIVLHLDRLVKK